MDSKGGVKKILDAYPSLERINPLKEDILAMIEKSILGSIDNAIDIAKDYINHQAAEKVIKFKPKAFQTFKKYFFDYSEATDSKEGYQTIVHGDAWQNNAMFR